MRVGIDASNLRGGGGITHLRSLLAHTVPERDGLQSVIVWGGKKTLDMLAARPWLERVHEPSLDGRLPARLLWRYRRLPRLARQSCDLLFAPGGSCTASFRPVVTMSRNLLPFDLSEAGRYGPSWVLLRTLLLRLSQSRSFRCVDGMIFLTEHARNRVTEVTGQLPGRTTIIPHGVDASFLMEPRVQRPLSGYSPSQPYRLVYVSIIDLYKHPWNVVAAVAQLRKEGVPLVLELIGPSYPPAMRRLQQALDEYDPRREFVTLPGPISHQDLPQLYQSANLFVFASTCENMPNILLEGMAAGLPIACSDRGPMPEVLGTGGEYFDPLDVASIAAALRRLLMDPNLRTKRAAEAYRHARDSSWDRCARQTWSFLRSIADENRRPG